MSSEKTRELFDKAGGKLLTFKLGSQEFGIQILEAREVVGMMKIEPIPQTPAFMKGVINLRGNIIPVIDLRTKFKMEPAPDSKENCIIKVDIHGRVTGAVVDFLVGVTTCEESEFEEELNMGAHIDTRFLHGICKKKDRVIFVLDMQAVLSNDELAKIHNEAQAQVAE